MNTELLYGQLDPNKIIVGERLRPLNPEKVAELERSIVAIGLQHPITIREPDGKPTLVAGAHRLQAVKNLGWNEIPVREFDGDDRAARMWEISENLHRAELTMLERSEQTAEWIRLAGEEVQSAQVDPIESKRTDGRGHRPESGINRASRDLGIDRKAAQRAAKIDSLAPEAKAEAVELGLDDNQSALLEAAKVETAEGQVETLKQRKAKKASGKKSATAAKAAAKAVGPQVAATPATLQPGVGKVKELWSQLTRDEQYTALNWLHSYEHTRWHQICKEVRRAAEYERARRAVLVEQAVQKPEAAPISEPVDPQHEVEPALVASEAEQQAVAA
jgi:ParB-like chromosome segregation protein Spo0J